MTTAERLRADLAEVLEEDVSRIGPDDDLFERGIDSVRLMLLVERWHSLGIEVDFASLAEKPTLARWEDLLGGAGMPASRQEPTAVTLTVQRVERLTPRTVRITLAGQRVAQFAAASPADHAILKLPDGAWRSVTVRYHGGSGELDLDVVAHEHGPMGRWATRVTLGETVTVTGPCFAQGIPEADWLLFAVDLPALPAAAQRVERAPAGTRVVVCAVVPDAAEEIDLLTAADLTVHWLGSPADLAGFVTRSKLPLGEGAAWVAGGAALVDAANSALATRPEFGGRVLTEPYPVP